MPRKNLIRSQSHPYHVTARSNNRENFPCDLNEVWKTLNSQLSEVVIKNLAKIHAFVVMPNHFHLIISTPEDDLGVVMQNFMRASTKIINSKTNRSGRIFGAKYHWSLIDNTNYYDYALKYVYRNPVKATLCLRSEHYQFSTLSYILSDKQLPYLLFPPPGEKTLIPNDKLNEFIDWLNIPFNTELDLSINHGLKNTQFQLKL
jgi:putative transposase